MTPDDLAHDLRCRLTEAICTAQRLPLPRPAAAKMLLKVLHHALELLDDDRPVEWDVAQRVAIHALASWNTLRSDTATLASVAARA